MVLSQMEKARGRGVQRSGLMPRARENIEKKSIAVLYNQIK